MPNKLKSCGDGGDCENNLRIVRMESALRIIVTLAKVAQSETTYFVLKKLIEEIQREAKEATQ